MDGILHSKITLSYVHRYPINLTQCFTYLRCDIAPTVHQCSSCHLRHCRRCSALLHSRNLPPDWMIHLNPQKSGLDFPTLQIEVSIVDITELQLFFTYVNIYMTG